MLMSDEQAHRIANLAVALALAQKSLWQYEHSDYAPSESTRLRVPDLQRQLDAAIEEVLVAVKKGKARVRRPKKRT